MQELQEILCEKAYKPIYINHWMENCSPPAKQSNGLGSSFYINNFHTNFFWCNEKITISYVFILKTTWKLGSDPRIKDVYFGLTVDGATNTRGPFAKWNTCPQGDKMVFDSSVIVPHIKVEVFSWGMRKVGNAVSIQMSFISSSMITVLTSLEKVDIAIQRNVTGLRIERNHSLWVPMVNNVIPTHTAVVDHGSTFEL